MSRKLRVLLGLSILSGLSGCAGGLIEGETKVTVVSEYCKIAAPISYDSKVDSPETVAAIEKHNSQWVCLCEGDCPK